MSSPTHRTRSYPPNVHGAYIRHVYTHSPPMTTATMARPKTTEQPVPVAAAISMGIVLYHSGTTHTSPGRVVGRPCQLRAWAYPGSHPIARCAAYGSQHAPPRSLSPSFSFDSDPQRPPWQTRDCAGRRTIKPSLRLSGASTCPPRPRTGQLSIRCGERLCTFRHAMGNRADCLGRLLRARSHLGSSWLTRIGHDRYGRGWYKGMRLLTLS